MSHQHLSTEALGTWEANSAFWNESVGVQGNVYWQDLQEPCLRRLLGERLASHDAGSEEGCCRALELTTGNGIGARWLAARGARVTATDGAAGMLEGARTHGDGEGRITYGKLDVTRGEDFVPFVEQAAAVSVISLSM